MKKKIIFFSIMAFLLLFVYSCSTKVETGTITICKICGKEISNTVKLVSVNVWDKDKYRVKKRSAYCDICGNEKATYKLHVKCQRCGKT